MLSENLTDLQNYLRYLTDTHGFYVSAHAFDASFSAVIARVAPLNIHASPYCLYVKSDPALWDRCVAGQEKIRKKLEENGRKPFYGACHAGVGEYVVPVEKDGRLLGFISVGSFRGDAGKMRRAAKKYALPGGDLAANYRSGLAETPPDAELVMTLVSPVRAMLLYEYVAVPPLPFDGKTARFAAALAFVHRRFADGITKARISEASGLAARTLERCFVRETGLTPLRYVEKLRMEKAASLLVSSSLSVTETAFLCGYTDSCRFSARFKAFYGVSPTQMRKNAKKKS